WARAASGEETAQTKRKCCRRELARFSARAGSLWTTTALTGLIRNSCLRKRRLYEPNLPQTATDGPLRLFRVQRGLRRAALGAPAIWAFCAGVEWLRLQLSVLLEKDLHFALRSLQFLTAGTGKSNAFLKELERLLQWQVSAFELLDDLFQLLKALFKLGQNDSPNT